jgi:16S rRNA processing protein RimM
MFVSIGRISKTHGVDGALKLKIKDRYFDDFAEAKALFVQIGGKDIPFFIEEFRGGMDPIVKFEDLDNREEAQKLAGKEVFLRESDLLSETSSTVVNQYERYQGYLLIDQALGKIGPINEVMEMPGQYMAALEYKSREVLIPLNTAFILEVDHQKKTLQMDLPEGLLEL